MTEPITTYAPILWATLSDEERYALYIQLREDSDSQIAWLESQHAELEAAFHQKRAALVIAETSLQRLRGAVTPYLKHKSECASNEYMIAPPRGPKPACDCGLSEILLMFSK